MNKNISDEILFLTIYRQNCLKDINAIQKLKTRAIKKIKFKKLDYFTFCTIND